MTSTQHPSFEDPYPFADRRLWALLTKPLANELDEAGGQTPFCLSAGIDRGPGGTAVLATPPCAWFRATTEPRREMICADASPAGQALALPALSLLSSDLLKHVSSVWLKRLPSVAYGGYYAAFTPDGVLLLHEHAAYMLGEEPPETLLMALLPPGLSTHRVLGRTARLAQIASFMLIDQRQDHPPLNHTFQFLPPERD